MSIHIISTIRDTNTMRLPIPISTRSLITNLIPTRIITQIRIKEDSEHGTLALDPGDEFQVDADGIPVIVRRSDQY